MNKLTPNRLMKMAEAASVLLSVRCECPGFFVNAKQYVDGQWIGSWIPGPPQDVPLDLLDQLTAHAQELESALREAGEWSCACDSHLTAEELAKVC